MQYARLSSNGRLVTLPDFLKMEQAAGTNITSSGPKFWSNAPSCPDCGAPVHPYDIAGALGFRQNAREIGGGLLAQSRTGFHHHDNTAAADCPQNFANDPRFQELGHHQFDGRVRKVVLETLSHADHKLLNERVLAALLRRLKGVWPTEDEVISQLKSAHARLSSMVVLKDHPWLLPYLWVRMLGHQTAVSASGKPYITTFVLGRSQSLSFQDLEGNNRSATVPSSLIAAFVNGKGSKQNFPRMTRGDVDFPVTREGAYSLANLQMPEAISLVTRKAAGNGQQIKRSPEQPSLF